MLWRVFFVSGVGGYYSVTAKAPKQAVRRARRLERAQRPGRKDGPPARLVKVERW
jgi:hypothetical protein